MPAAGACVLNKCDVMMYLSLANLKRSYAAAMAGVSRATFMRAMRRHKVKAPRSDAVLTATKVREIRVLLEKHTQEEAAVISGAPASTVGRVARCETWYWVK